MYRFALRGRWLAGLVGLLVVTSVCVRLGVWQLDRRDERLAFNATVAERAEQLPAPFDVALSEADGDPDAVEYRTVSATGTYDAEREFLIRARSYQGSPGEHVVTPLVLDDGRAILVNRGFVPLVDPTAPVPEAAKPPAERVDVVGVARAPQAGGRFDPASDGAQAAGTLGFITRVDVERVGRELPYDLVPLSIWIEDDRPDEAGVPIPLLPPELGEGPHLPYAIQWFGFALVFLVGWGLLVRRHAAGLGRPSSNGRGTTAR